MRFRSLQTRFLLTGCFLVLITVAGGAWSVVTLMRLSTVVGEMLQESQETIDLTANLADMLEREDDALVQALSGQVRNARSEVTRQRQEFDESYRRLLSRLLDPEQQEAARALGVQTAAYRQVGDVLLREAGQPGARDAYHQQVNPALRKAVADCARLRELNFAAMRQVGVLASNETRRATGIVAGIALIALGLSTVVMARLAQGIVRPIRELTRSVDAIRRDDYKCRVRVDSEDELGQLADGFNRMAARLSDYRESSLGELLLAKATLEATLAALPDAVIVVDPDGQIVSRNPLAAKILEALDGVTAARVGELLLPSPIVQDVHEVLRTGQARRARADLSQALSVSVDGRPLKVLVTVVPIPEFLPRRAGAAIVFADVTEFARLDELRSEVVAVASHELKTPLTALQMNLMLLQEKMENLTSRQQEIVAAAVHGGEELGATIDELLDLTRIEAGQLRVEQQRVDLVPLLEHVARTLGPRYEDAEVGLRVVPQIPEAIVRGDAARLRLVFLNVLTNALKYTPRQGEVVVRLASMQNAAAPAKAGLQITVTDTGPGIPPELRERVFDKFFRVEDERPDGLKGVRGTGIGLYLCREIIQAHGGTIQCTAGEDGRGTRIAITLDRDESQG